MQSSIQGMGYAIGVCHNNNAQTGSTPVLCYQDNWEVPATYKTPSEGTNGKNVALLEQLFECQRHVL